MSIIRIPPQILIAMIIILSVITLSYDFLEFYSSLSISTWKYAHEGFNLLILFLYFLYIKGKPIYVETNVTTNLKNFIKSLALLYFTVLILKQILSPNFLEGAFPKEPEDEISLVYSNLISLASIVFIVPMLVSIKNLIYYKRRKRTPLYIYLALISTLLAIILSVFFETPLDFEFSGYEIFPNSAMVLALVFIFILSTRNSWITYLTRKQKYYYFLVNGILVWVILILFDIAFRDPLPAHSLALGSWSNISYLFLATYSIMSGLNFLLHLPTARVFDRKMKEVSSLHKLSRAISVEFEYDKLVRLITEMTAEVIESSKTWLEMYEQQNSRLVVAASKDLDPENISILNEGNANTITDQIVQFKKSIIINEPVKSADYEVIANWNMPIGSLAGVPLIAANGQVLGILFAVKPEIFGFDPDDVNMLEAYANQAVIALENSKLLKSSFERERMEQELQIAREVQMRLLPQELPVLPDLQIDTLTITAYEVGGDYYDFYSQDDSNLGLIIGDVSGKGTSAAFYMAETKGIIQSLVQSYSSPRDILIQANKILFRSMEKRSFISLLAVDMDCKKNQIKFARAGHCPILHYNAKSNETSLLQPEGLAVGIDDGKVFDSYLKEHTLKLGSGDILAFYTDGLSEAMNIDNEEFGEERLCEIIRSNAGLEVSELKDTVIDHILKFLDGKNLHDDLTLILLKI